MSGRSAQRPALFRCAVGIGQQPHPAAARLVSGHSDTSPDPVVGSGLLDGGRILHDREAVRGIQTDQQPDHCRHIQKIVPVL